jgi:hypothetical protein
MATTLGNYNAFLSTTISVGKIKVTFNGTTLGLTEALASAGVVAGSKFTWWEVPYTWNGERPVQDPAKFQIFAKVPAKRETPAREFPTAVGWDEKTVKKMVKSENESRAKSGAYLLGYRPI